ncbi:MAG TPA: sugar phosphate isomerase/epimerase family protein [Terracidiphilus sp.]|nr:sugar phosphate isomerase/epimerase family protein [Terracidiphilus sp.]
MTMFRVLSTHLFIHQRLHPGILDLAGHAGAEGVEIFAARQHFDYTSREHISELGAWFRSNNIQAFSLHAPIFPDREMGRDGAPSVNVLHPDKARRIEAMDEIKRALESAEHIPLRYLVVHLGDRSDTWSPRSMEYGLTALEHLGAFAAPLGVRLLVENILNEPTTPAHLQLILQTGHLDNVGVCLDLGHAHISPGIQEAVGILGDRIASMHVHDNHGARDEHLWPGEGTIDWTAVNTALKGLANAPAAVLEIAHKSDDSSSAITAKMKQAYASLNGKPA